jgi:hypothetical protein
LSVGTKGRRSPGSVRRGKPEMTSSAGSSVPNADTVTSSGRAADRQCCSQLDPMGAKSNASGERAQSSATLAERAMNHPAMSGSARRVSLGSTATHHMRARRVRFASAIGHDWRAAEQTLHANFGMIDAIMLGKLHGSSLQLTRSSKLWHVVLSLIHERASLQAASGRWLLQGPRSRYGRASGFWWTLEHQAGGGWH